MNERIYRWGVVVAESSEDFKLFGNDLFGNHAAPAAGGPLASEFILPPFSVLSARDGAWQERKRAWCALGIKSELGRDGARAFSQGLAGADYIGDRSGHKDSAFQGANTQSVRTGIKDLAKHEGLTFKGAAAAFDYYGVKEGTRETTDVSGTSVFDPVLCELAYRWFCVPGGQVLDPFAGGSVRGIVAGLLGFKYHGIDLRQEQIAANVEQRDDILGRFLPGFEETCNPVTWACGDAIDLTKAAPEADFIFTCPPYGDLEQYSDDPRDLSTMEYHTFIAAFKRIMLRCYARLKHDRFACVVVGDFRDPATGMCRGFVADTINAFKEIGMRLYNDAVLVTAVGSLPVRVAASFNANRKLGKTHQNVLVFAKGQPARAFSYYEKMSAAGVTP